MLKHKMLNYIIIIIILIQLCACQKSLTKLLAPSIGQWSQCCDDVMKIELPSPRKPAIVTPKQGSLYHEMGECVQTPFYTFTVTGGEFEALDCHKIKPRANTQYTSTDMPNITAQICLTWIEHVLVLCQI